MNTMKTPTLLRRFISGFSPRAALLALGLLTGAPLPVLAAPSLRAYLNLPSLGYGTYANVPANLAASLQTGAAENPRITVAYSKQHRRWLEVRPVGPVSVESVRNALTQSEAIFAAEEAMRQQAAEEAQMQREAGNWERYNVWRVRKASQPSGAGLAAAIAAQNGPTVINTTTVTTCRPTVIYGPCPGRVLNAPTGNSPCKPVTGAKTASCPTRK